MIHVDGRETNPVISTLVSHQVLNSNAALESDVFLTRSVLHDAQLIPRDSKHPIQ